MRVWLRWGAGLALASAVALGGCASAAAVPPRQAVAPFELALFDAGVLRLAELRGKVVVVNFWASWCVPCREEAPDLRQAWERYRDADVVFLGIDMKGDEPRLARAFVAELGVPYPSGQDVDGRIADDFKVISLPNTFVLDRQGRIAHRFIGPVKRERLVEVVEATRAEPGGG